MSNYYLRDKDGLIDAYTDARQVAQQAMQQDLKMRDDVHIVDDAGNRVAELHMERIELKEKSVAIGETHRDEKNLHIIAPEFRAELGDDADEFDKKAARERGAVRAQEAAHTERQAALDAVTQVPDLASHAKPAQGQEQQEKPLSLREQIARDVQLLRLQNTFDDLNSMFNLDGKHGSQTQARDTQEQKQPSAEQRPDFENRVYYLHAPDELGRDQREQAFETASGAIGVFMRDHREGAYLADEQGERHGWKERDDLKLKTHYTEEFRQHFEHECNQFDVFAKEKGIEIGRDDIPKGSFEEWLVEQKQLKAERQQEQEKEEGSARLETTLRQQQGQEHDFSHGC